MTKSNEPQALPDFFDSPGSRVVRRAPLRKDAATTDITIPRLETHVHRYEPHEPREPPAEAPASPPRVVSDEAITRDLTEGLRGELARLGRRAGARMRAAVVRLSPVTRHARRTLRKHASATLVAASAGLVAGVILSGELGDGATAESEPRYAQRTSSEVGGMCELPPTPIALLRAAPRQPAAVAAASAVRPARAAVPRLAARSVSRSRVAATRPHAVRKRAASEAAPARAAEAVSEARRAALLEEAQRAEKAELAEAHFERSERRPRVVRR
jgi:hypothetical protein